MLIACRNPGQEVSVKLDELLIRSEITNQYIEHPRTYWVLWNYFRRYGLKAVINKTKSRLSESRRNKKEAGICTGVVCEAPDGSDFEVGQRVLLFAYNHNLESPIIVLDMDFVIGIDSSYQKGQSGKALDVQPDIPEELDGYIGWSPYSGKALDKCAIRAALTKILDHSLVATRQSQLFDERDCISKISHSIEVPPQKTNKPTAVLFGLGNYAKTIILPNIKPFLALQRVHEIDPDQLEYFGSNPDVSLDTSPFPASVSNYDAWFIAGYHHTHTDLALAALKHSAAAVIEKPLATTKDQFHHFLNVVDTLEAPKYFLCFQKRYSLLNECLGKDLDLAAEQGVDMHCIVYEIPLPDHHWYNWPNSGSRLVSNGCHWIDYFLFLNNYQDVKRMNVWKARGDDICVQIQLVNDAYLSMSLTDSGSQRLGVRDHIELRQADRTVKIIDSTYYECEDRQRVLRRKKVNPLGAYSNMYRTISKKITMGQQGDAMQSLLSSSVTLELEGMLSDT